MSWKVWRYVRWFICAAVGLAICTVVVLYERGAYPDYTPLRLLSDGCFVTGVMVAGIGALAAIANLDGFNAIGYAGYLIKRKRFSSGKKFDERLSYLEYVQLNGDKKKKKPWHLIVTGLFWLAAAGVTACFV